MSKKRKILTRAGWPLLGAGCLMLAIGYPTALNNSNVWLLSSLAAVLAGTILCVWKKKQESDY